MRLTLLLTSPRVAPGLMTADAWAAVAAASLVACSDSARPVARAVAAAGHRVEQRSADVDALLDVARRGPVVWLASDEEATTLPPRLAALLVSDPPPVETEVMHASYDVPGARLLDLVAVMDRLRTDCPWDREQTHRSLARYLLEETYELLEALETRDDGGPDDTVHLREELGDLLLQVVFHARIASEREVEEGGFTIDDVAAGIVDKLVYRHPHVFAGLDVADAAEVDRNWDALKAAEKQRAGVLDGIPLAMPALALADAVLGRLEKVGIPPLSPARGLGADLLALVARARAEGLDPEQALRDAVRTLA